MLYHRHGYSYVHAMGRATEVHLVGGVSGGRVPFPEVRDAVSSPYVRLIQSRRHAVEEKGRAMRGFIESLSMGENVLSRVLQHRILCCEGLPMRAMNRFWGVTAVVGIALSMGARAQQPEALQPQTASSRSITLDVVAAAKNGAPMPGLAQGDFTVLDNKSAETPTSFRALNAGSAAAEAVVVIDAININYTRLAYARDQIEKFLSADGGRLAVPTTIAVVTDTETKMLPHFTKDGNALSAAVKSDQIGLRAIRQSAGFYGAQERLDLSLKAMRQMMGQLAGQPGRKLLVWVSPGWPLLSGPRINLDAKARENIFNNVQALSHATRVEQITLYDVNPLGAGESVQRATYYQSYVKGVTKPGQADLADLSLQVLSVQSGGLVLDESNDVAGGLKRCLGDTETYYELTFQPAPGEPNEYHQLQVKLDKPGLEARTRTGYYSAP